MIQIGFKTYLVLFLKYFLGYFLTVFLVLLVVMNGRAMLAQAQWTADRFIDQVARGSFGKKSVSVAVQKKSLSDAGDLEPELTKLIESVVFSESDTYLLIPKISVRAPIVFPDTFDNSELLQFLEKGVLKYPESADFGKPGVTIVLGHSSAYPWYKGKYGSVFALLEKLEKGDKFAIVKKDGTKYFYVVSNKKVFVPKDFKIEINDNKSHIVLISCWPVRSNKMRMTVWADLVKTE